MEECLVTGVPRAASLRTACVPRHASSMDVVTALDTLGLDAADGQPSAEKLKRCFRKQVLRWHPDMSDGDASRLQQVKEAYLVLAKSKTGGPKKFTFSGYRPGSIQEMGVEDTEQLWDEEATEQLWEDLLKEVKVGEPRKARRRRRGATEPREKFIDNSLPEDVERLADKDWPKRPPPALLGFLPDGVRVPVKIFADVWLFVALFAFLAPPSVRIGVIDALKSIAS